MEVRINVQDIVGEKVLVRIQDGQKLYAEIYKALSEGNEILLAFEKDQVVYTPFLNAAVGQLFNSGLETSTLPSRIRVEGLDEFSQGKFNRVMGNAPRYFANAKVYDEILDREVSS